MSGSQGASGTHLLAQADILGRQCLDRRIDNVETLTREVAAWETQRNAAKAKVNWRFTTNDARIRLKKLYPSFEV